MKPLPLILTLFVFASSSYRVRISPETECRGVYYCNTETAYIWPCKDPVITEFILLHEYGHYLGDCSSEEYADEYAYSVLDSKYDFIVRFAR